MSVHVTNVYAVIEAGPGVTLAYVTVKYAFVGQLAMSMKIDMPETATGGAPDSVHVPLYQEMCPAPAAIVGVVQPAGISNFTCEPAPKSALAVKVKTKVALLAPYVTVVGATAIRPSPSVAGVPRGLAEAITTATVNTKLTTSKTANKRVSDFRVNIGILLAI